MAVSLDLAGRTAIVTGAGRGIGEVIALRLAEAGADVVAAARSTDEIEATVSAVEDLGADGLAVPTDLSQTDDVDALVEQTVAEFGTPHVLVNNAGAVVAHSSIEEYSPAEVDTMLDVNMRGVFLLSRRFGLAYRDGDPAYDGRIINVSSVLGQLGVPSRTAYGSTKAGVHGMTRGLAADFAGDGITVNCVTPGLIEIERITEVIEHTDREFDVDAVPLSRLGRPEDVADACLFFASDLARYVTGTNVNVDGGVRFTASLYDS